MKDDAPPAGRKPAISAQIKEELIRRTTQSKSANATHWNKRTMATEMGVREATVRRIWHTHGLKPHLVESFKLSKDKHFAECYPSAGSPRPPLALIAGASRAARIQVPRARDLVILRCLESPNRGSDRPERTPPHQRGVCSVSRGGRGIASGKQ
jgi:hypothetical protein